MPQIQLDVIDTVVIQTLTKCRVSVKNAKIISDSILFAHRTGKGTHGISRLPIYVKKINNGSLNPTTEFSVVKDRKVVAVLDAENGFGQLAAHKAVEMAIEKAKEFGVGIVGVRNSNNFGTAAYFLNQAAQENFISTIYSNSAPALAPWGGSKAVFGTNPIGYGFPVGEGKAPILLDMATSFAARGKIRLAAKNNEKIPLGWALDQNGNPTEDPNEALKGTLVPIGEHKGAGLSMIVDLFAGLLTGAGFAGDVLNLNTNGEYSRNGHFVMVLNIDFFMSPEEYQLKIEYLISKIKEQQTTNTIKYPGESAFENSKTNSEYVQISDKVVSEINQLLTQLELNISM
jgi:L-2-hydroxycarboxylate dehydrogenase (NAD+)